jgi:hypothetical protein
MRRFAATVILAGTLAALSGVRAGKASSLLSVDYPWLVAHADLAYIEAARRSEEGLPVGNGRMGSLVWTTPSAAHLQINRVDVFGNSSASTSFPERHTDYCGGCGFVDIDFVGAGGAVFPTNATPQHLSCYDGSVDVEGDGVSLRVIAWDEKDVMAIRVTDDRPTPGPISIALRMLRPPVVQTGEHTASSMLDDSHIGRIVLKQQFTEGDYYCGSAVAISVADRAAKVERPSENEYRLVVTPGHGSFTVLISSAASFDHNKDVGGSAAALLERAEARGFERIAGSSLGWWKDFWSKSFVHLHSADGVADQIEQNYTYYLYVMASTSRGNFPTKFNGMLWSTGGDTRKWGAQYWGANQSCLYNNALFAANHDELMQPMFRMYSGMLESCAQAARQQWGSQGVFIPETVAFDGLAPLPDDIASEMRDLYLLRKPWSARSQQFLDYAGKREPHSSRWNWIQSGKWVDGHWTFQERGGGPYGPVTHIFSRGAKIAYQYWVRHEYTHDSKWLRKSAYPILKGVAEFYRNYPNLKKEADGKYHIHNVNSNEGIWGAQDTDEEISSMMGVLPVVIRASEILKTDESLRSDWRELLANLAPLPVNEHPGINSPPTWARGLPPAVRGFVSGRPDGNTMPEWFFDLCTLESDPAMRETGNATFAAYFPTGSFSQRRISVLSKLPLAAAILGRADAVEQLIPNQILRPEVPILANRMDLREGEQTTSVQRLGNAADALHTALCQDLPSGPGQPPAIRVFAAWPRTWDAEYTLLCRGGFLVTSAMSHGEIQFVEIQSQLGGECRLRNPWGNGQVDLHRNGHPPVAVSGDLLEFSNSKGGDIILVRAGDTPENYKRVIGVEPSR